MERRAAALAAAVLGLALTGPASAPRAQADDPLAPVAFLIGRWEGEGHGPVGPFAYDLEATRRGDWLLVTAATRSGGEDGGPTAPPPLVTAVVGRDGAGHLVSHMFDDDGARVESGSVEPVGVRFEWVLGGSRRETLLLPQEDGGVVLRRSLSLPRAHPQPNVTLQFESTLRRVE